MDVIFISAVSLVADESSMVKSPFVGLGKNFTLTSPAFFSVQSVTILTDTESGNLYPEFSFFISIGNIFVTRSSIAGVNFTGSTHAVQ